ARLGAFGRNARDDVARLHVAAGVDRQNRVDRQQIARLAAPRQLEDLAVLALDDDGRPQILLAAGRTRAPVDDDALGDAGRLVKRFRHRLAFGQVLERGRAFALGEDRAGVGLPLRDALAALDVIALLDLHAGAVLDAVDGALGAVLIHDNHRHVARHADE